jgi:hypothetical protein
MLGKKMIESIRAWIGGGGLDREHTGAWQDALRVALPALLVEAAPATTDSIRQSAQ